MTLLALRYAHSCFDDSVGLTNKLNRHGHTRLVDWLLRAGNANMQAQSMDVSQILN